jgi:hypothetical protein
MTTSSVAAARVNVIARRRLASASAAPELK